MTLKPFETLKVSIQYYTTKKLATHSTILHPIQRCWFSNAVFIISFLFSCCTVFKVAYS